MDPERFDEQCHYLAAMVYDEIVRRNNQCYPTTSEAWRRVARRFGLTIKSAPLQRSFGACLIDDLILISDFGNEADLCRWIAHEIVEYALRSDVCEPMNMIPSCANAMHRIAQIVEKWA